MAGDDRSPRLKIPGSFTDQLLKKSISSLRRDRELNQNPKRFIQLCEALGKNYSLELSPLIYRETELKSTDSILQSICDDNGACHVDLGCILHCS